MLCRKVTIVYTISIKFKSILWVKIINWKVSWNKEKLFAPWNELLKYMCVYIHICVCVCVCVCVCIYNYIDFSFNCPCLWSFPFQPIHTWVRSNLQTVLNQNFCFFSKHDDVFYRVSGSGREDLSVDGLWYRRDWLQQLEPLKKKKQLN